MRAIKLFLDEFLFKLGIKKYVEWCDNVAHISVSGTTGTGKTVAIKIIILSALFSNPGTVFYILDYKGDKDYMFLDGYEHYYRFDKVAQGFEAFHKMLLDRQQHMNGDEPEAFLLFEEYASFLNSFTVKKEQDTYKTMMATLLMLARSFKMHVILSSQRLSADMFQSTRDNFGIVTVLGNPSKEVVSMLFSDFAEKIDNSRERGTGYVLINGAEFKKICVPYIKDMTWLETQIVKRLCKLEVCTEERRGAVLCTSPKAGPDPGPIPP